MTGAQALAQGRGQAAAFSEAVAQANLGRVSGSIAAGMLPPALDAGHCC